MYRTPRQAKQKTRPGKKHLWHKKTAVWNDLYKGDGAEGRHPSREARQKRRGGRAPKAPAETPDHEGRQAPAATTGKREREREICV